jgi:hypothetical protein
VCGRPNVGVGNVRVSDSSSPHHNADTLARACGLAQTSATPCSIQAVRSVNVQR